MFNLTPIYLLNITSNNGGYMKKLCIAIAVVFALATIFWFIKGYIYKGKLFPCCRIISYIIVPPNDLYTILFSKNIDFSKKGASIEITYKHNYPGMHTIGLICKNWSPYNSAENIEPKYIVDVELIDNKKIVIKKTISDYPYWFWGQNGAGLVLLHYNVPKDVSLDSIVICRVTVVKPDTIFNKTHGPLMICAAKDTEK